MTTFVVVLLLVQLSVAFIVPIPAPNGTYGVNVTTLALTDTSRLEPFAPKPENRSMMLSIFTPIASSTQCEWERSQYMPNATAQVIAQEFAPYNVTAALLEAFQLTVCTSKQLTDTANNKDAVEPSFPLVLFSTGLGNSRLIYNVMAQSVASRGYVVVTVDSPYATDAVEFPDGRIVLGANVSWTVPLLVQEVETRAQDMTFILNNLDAIDPNHYMTTQAPRTRPVLNLNRVGMFGHSIGGASAGEAMLNDRRIVGGVNLDGELLGPVIETGLHDPFMFFANPNHTDDPTWLQIWPELDWKLEVMLEGSVHGSFEDLPLLAQLLGWDPLPPVLVPLLGSVAGTRVVEVVTSYVVAFFDMVLKCEPEGLLQRPSADFPDVVFVR